MCSALPATSFVSVADSNTSIKLMKLSLLLELASWEWILDVLAFLQLVGRWYDRLGRDFQRMGMGVWRYGMAMRDGKDGGNE